MIAATEVEVTIAVISRREKEGKKKAKRAVTCAGFLPVIDNTRATGASCSNNGCVRARRLLRFLHKGRWGTYRPWILLLDRRTFDELPRPLGCSVLLSIERWINIRLLAISWRKKKNSPSTVKISECLGTYLNLDILVISCYKMKIAK